MRLAWIFAVVPLAGQVAAPVATTKQLMLDMIHPASNEILLFVNRGNTNSETEWAGVRRSALALAEAGNLLAVRGSAQPQWKDDAKLLADAGTAAYNAAQAKDPMALAAAAGQIDASCTTCHKRYRPEVFPAEGGSK
jgi:Cytochrome C'